MMKHLLTAILIAALLISVATDLHAKRIFSKPSKPEKPAIIRLQTIPGGCSLFISGTAIDKTTEAGKWLEIQCPEGKQHVAVIGDSAIVYFDIKAKTSKMTIVVANLFAGTVYAGSSRDKIDSLSCKVIRDSLMNWNDNSPCDSQASVPASSTQSVVSQKADSTEAGQFIAVEKQPEMISEIEPIYPRQAKQAGISGLVWVSALVDKDGNVRCAKVARSSRSKLLDAAAAAAAYKCKYKPAEQNGQPVACWVTYKMTFTLDE